MQTICPSFQGEYCRPIRLASEHWFFANKITSLPSISVNWMSAFPSQRMTSSVGRHELLSSCGESLRKKYHISSINRIICESHDSAIEWVVQLTYSMVSICRINTEFKLHNQNNANIFFCTKLTVLIRRIYSIAHCCHCYVRTPSTILVSTSIEVKFYVLRRNIFSLFTLHS